MPWFPDFVSAVELVRRQTREAGQADPVAQYLAALSTGDSGRLETVWPGKVLVFDPRAGEVHGHRQLRHFVHTNMAWLAERGARIETTATTTIEGRAVVELLAYLDGGRVTWPVAVVAESPDDSSVVFRTYCSQWPVDGRRHIRPPILTSTVGLPGDVVGDFQAALAAGDAEALVSTFLPDGYYREPIGEHAMHRKGRTNCARSSALASPPAMVTGASRCSPASSRMTPCGARWSTACWAGVAPSFRRKRVSRCTSEAATGCWQRSGSTTTSSHRPSRHRGPTRAQGIRRIPPTRR